MKILRMIMDVRTFFIALQLLLACGAGYSVYRALIYKEDSSQNETDEM